MRRRKTESIGDLGHHLITKIDPGGKRYESKAVQTWPLVAGEEIVKHTQGFAMREGELVVFVDSPVWANELTLMAERLRENLNSHIGQGSVRAIRFTVSKRVKEEQRWEMAKEADDEYYKPDPTQPIPLSRAELDQAEDIARAVTDPELRDKALRVMVKDLERKKGARSFKEAQAGTGEAEKADSSS